MFRRRRPIVTRTNDWPPPPRRIEPLPDAYPDPRSVVKGVVYGVAVFGLILASDWLWRHW